MNERLYIAYDGNDDVICIGTIDELVKVTGKTKGSIYSIITRTRRGERQYGWGIYVVDEL